MKNKNIRVFRNRIELEWRTAIVNSMFAHRCFLLNSSNCDGTTKLKTYRMLVVEVVVVDWHSEAVEDWFEKPHRYLGFHLLSQI